MSRSKHVHNCSSYVYIKSGLRKVGDPACKSLISFDFYEKYANGIFINSCMVLDPTIPHQKSAN